MRISAVIITLNEAANIGRCLDSLMGVADEVIVVDSGSTDETKQICLQKGARFLTREWAGYAATKNWANAQATGEYILSVDADEALSEDLRTSIIAAKPTLSGAYRMARFTRFIDHWVRYGGWYPDRKVRLFPKGQAHWEGNYVHERLVLAEALSIRELKGDLLHYSFASLSDYWHRADRYTTLAAEQMWRQGKRSTWLKRWGKPKWVFFRMLWLRQGFRDGQTGWTLARLSATYEWLKQVKLRELERRAKAEFVEN